METASVVAILVDVSRRNFREVLAAILLSLRFESLLPVVRGLTNFALFFVFLYFLAGDYCLGVVPSV